LLTEAEAFKLCKAFDKGEREEEEDGESAEPVGDGVSAGSGAGEDTDGVEAGEDDDVYQDDSFELEGVCGGGDGVDGEPAEEAKGADGSRAEEGDEMRQGDGDADGCGEESDHDGDAMDGGEISGGEGAAALGVVAAIRFKVQQVIDDVGGGGAEAEAEKGEQGAGDGGDGVRAVPGMGEQERQKDEGVFGPLVEADGFEPGLEGGSGIEECLCGSDAGSAERGGEA